MSNSYLNYHEEIALGNHSQKFPVNKFGEAPSGIQTTPTDVWSRANAVPTQQIWLAPTAARIHTISSDSAADDDAGTGSNKIRIWYLPSWDLRETFEDVEGDIASGIAMVNAAVMINRMKALPQATTTDVGVNTGTIIATAAVDTTISAVILPSNGQTEMAILGVPSIQTFLMYHWGANIDKNIGGIASADFQLRVNEDPETAILGFLRKGDISVQSTGSSSVPARFYIPASFPGPAIIKIQGIASAADVDGSARFCGILADN